MRWQSHQGENSCDVSMISLVAHWPVFWPVFDLRICSWMANSIVQLLFSFLLQVTLHLVLPWFSNVCPLLVTQIPPPFSSWWSNHQSVQTWADWTWKYQVKFYLPILVPAQVWLNCWGMDWQIILHVICTFCKKLPDWVKDEQKPPKKSYKLSVIMFYC